MVTAAAKCGFELLPHTPYSTDLALWDFYLSSELKCVEKICLLVLLGLFSSSKSKNCLTVV